MYAVFRAAIPLEDTEAFVSNAAYSAQFGKREYTSITSYLSPHAEAPYTRAQRFTHQAVRLWVTIIPSAIRSSCQTTHTRVFVRRVVYLFWFNGNLLSFGCRFLVMRSCLGCIIVDSSGGGTSVV